MDSSDFRIIPHEVAKAANPAVPDLYRYIITYATTSQPKFIALDNEGQLMLVDDEKDAVRFGSIAGAQKRLNVGIAAGELQLGTGLPLDLGSAR
ncbi:MAG: hypothetical protein JWN70_5211 [Planctomycetaceae bacterium]|nr:hypothetical protein [Planctomycetaceae bacterium]